MAPDTILTLGYLNIRGQSGLSVVKQIQIQDFIKHHSCDILHLQESNIDADSFSTCDMVSSAYNIIQNNSTTGYGTASIIKSDLNYENIQLDLEGRAIIFDVGNLTLGNIYLPSGTDALSRAGRER